MKHFFNKFEFFYYDNFLFLSDRGAYEKNYKTNLLVINLKTWKVEEKFNDYYIIFVNNEGVSSNDFWYSFFKHHAHQNSIRHFSLWTNQINRKFKSIFNLIGFSLKEEGTYYYIDRKKVINMYGGKK